MAKFTTVELDGKGSARGRNGWFVPVDIDISEGTPSLSMPAQEVTIQVSSKRRGDCPPIYIALSVEDTRRLADRLKEFLEAGK